MMNIPRKRRFPLRPKPKKFTNRVKFTIHAPTMDMTAVVGAIKAGIAKMEAEDPPDVQYQRAKARLDDATAKLAAAVQGLADNWPCPNCNPPKAA